MNNRTSGILTHITSLPGSEGIGTLGNNAFLFVDFLANTNQKVWQILPLGPVGYGDSPYQCYSAFAGNEMLIDLYKLQKYGFISSEELSSPPRFKKDEVLFDLIKTWKLPILKQAFFTFKKNGLLLNEYEAFLENNSWWLHDYALFMACKQQFNDLIWNEWEHGLKFRDKKNLAKYAKELKEEINFQKFIQFLFFKQWTELKGYANSKGIKIIGDVPLYVSTDSADVWANPSLFHLDEELKPTQVGGVPPDYFSDDGQLWGNPVFNWEEMKKQNYSWWLARLHFNLNLFDLVRIDHFRGLSSYWSIDANEETAKNGRWVEAYGYGLLQKLQEQIGYLPLIAEDLGEIDDHVKNLRDDFDLPGMKVLQFGFASDETNEHLPHNYSHAFIAYTGTHDNNTTKGWYSSLTPNEKSIVKKYYQIGSRKIVQALIRSVWASTAQMAIIPMQDLLELSEEARMNIPGTASGNWAWRFQWKQLKQKHALFLKNITKIYNR